MNSAPASSPNGPRGERVVDAVAHQRALAVRRELVAVTPEPVRPPDLPVDEPRARLPLLDPRRHRHAVQAQAVPDERAGAHDGRVGRQELEPQPRRRDGLEVARVAEEGEHLVDRAPHHLSPFDAVDPHAVPDCNAALRFSSTRCAAP